MGILLGTILLIEKRGMNSLMKLRSMICGSHCSGGSCGCSCGYHIDAWMEAWALRCDMGFSLKLRNFGNICCIFVPRAIVEWVKV